MICGAMGGKQKRRWEEKAARRRKTAGDLFCGVRARSLPFGQLLDKQFCFALAALRQGAVSPQQTDLVIDQRCDGMLVFRVRATGEMI